ncbi:MAG: TerC family protein [Anaerolineales bacterium]|nr:TerC family protein [Anaerolineales bacterium]
MTLNWIYSPQTWIALFTLVALELVLGVDNIIFITILSGKLPRKDQGRGRTLGILLAVVTRILFLFSLSWIIGLKKPIFVLPWFGGGSLPISGRDFILILGGLFLIWKSTHEIYEKLEHHEKRALTRAANSVASVVVQIGLLDIVFSIDSVITAIGMVEHVEIMVMAVVFAAIIMIFVAGPIGNFVEEHPTIKILALSFLLMVGFTLVVEGFGYPIPKNNIYFAMGFSVAVELLNLRLRPKETEPARLNAPQPAEEK